MITSNTTLYRAFIALSGIFVLSALTVGSVQAQDDGWRDPSEDYTPSVQQSYQEYQTPPQYSQVVEQNTYQQPWYDFQEPQYSPASVQESPAAYYGWNYYTNVYTTNSSYALFDDNNWSAVVDPFMSTSTCASNDLSCMDIPVPARRANPWPTIEPLKCGGDSILGPVLLCQYRTLNYCYLPALGQCCMDSECDDGDSSTYDVCSHAYGFNQCTSGTG